jgi:methylmalonyl-CoA mutase
VTRIYSPRTASAWGWQGMIGEMVMRCDRDLTSYAPHDLPAIQGHAKQRAGARSPAVTALENGGADDTLVQAVRTEAGKARGAVAGHHRHRRAPASPRSPTN